MRLSLILLVVAAVGLIAGAWLVGTWAVGVAIMAESAGLAAYALLRDVPAPPQPTVRTIDDVLRPYRDSA